MSVTVDDVGIAEHIPIDVRFEDQGLRSSFQHTVVQLMVNSKAHASCAVRAFRSNLY